MKILYGNKENNIDITEYCFYNLKYNNIICIPDSNISRKNIFKDKVHNYNNIISNNINKIIIIYNDIETEYDENYIIYINTYNKLITSVNRKSINDKLELIKNKIKIMYGSLNDELSEQKMAITYLRGNEKILEIGGNIGRNSLIISTILGNHNNNLVVLESDTNIVKALEVNREINNLRFNIEPSALSKNKLIQIGWDTIQSDEILEGYKSVNIISLNEIYNKYNIIFDTLVIDCEGAFYYILKDFPEILQSIKLIIMENDYKDINHKLYVDNTLKKNNFKLDYFESGGWGICLPNFYEVWIKNE